MVYSACGAQTTKWLGHASKQAQLYKCIVHSNYVNAKAWRRKRGGLAMAWLTEFTLFQCFKPNRLPSAGAHCKRFWESWGVIWHYGGRVVLRGLNQELAVCTHFLLSLLIALRRRILSCTGEKHAVTWGFEMFWSQYHVYTYLHIYFACGWIIDTAI